MTINSFKNNLTENQKMQFTPGEIAQLLNYPAVGELFSDDSEKLADFQKNLSAAVQNLERIVRYGNRDEAESAEKVIRAANVTLKFLESLDEMRRQ